MLHYIVILHFVTLRHIMLHNITLLHNLILCYLALYYVTSRHVTSRHVTLVFSMWHYYWYSGIVWDVYRIFISTSMLYHILHWRWYIIKFNKFMKLTKCSFDDSYEIDKIINLMKVMKLTNYEFNENCENWVKLWSFFREINYILKDLNLEKFIGCYLSILFKSWSSRAMFKYLVLIIYEIFNSIWPLW